MAAETGFLINETLYEVPTLDSLDNDECLILFDYSGVVQEDFAAQEDETEEETSERNQKLMRHPGFWLGLMHIAYRRKHRELKPDKVKALIGRVNRYEAMSSLAGGEDEVEVDDNPPASTSEPEESSLSGSLVNGNSTGLSPASSGSDSTIGSGQPDEIPEATGDSRLVTSSLGSPPRTSGL